MLFQNEEVKVLKCESITLDAADGSHRVGRLCMADIPDVGGNASLMFDVDGKPRWSRTSKITEIIVHADEIIITTVNHRYVLERRGK